MCLIVDKLDFRVSRLICPHLYKKELGFNIHRQPGKTRSNTLINNSKWKKKERQKIEVFQNLTKTISTMCSIRVPMNRTKSSFENEVGTAIKNAAVDLALGHGSENETTDRNRWITSLRSLNFVVFDVGDFLLRHRVKYSWKLDYEATKNSLIAGKIKEAKKWILDKLIMCTFVKSMNLIKTGLNVIKIIV